MLYSTNSHVMIIVTTQIMVYEVLDCIQLSIHTLHPLLRSVYMNLFEDRRSSKEAAGSVGSHVLLYVVWTTHQVLR